MYEFGGTKVPDGQDQMIICCAHPFGAGAADGLPLASAANSIAAAGARRLDLNIPVTIAKPLAGK